jgi:double-stranded uracil-DNA glycosylase
MMPRRHVVEPPWRPTKEQLAAARRKKVPDLIAPGLAILFCGINPGLYSAAVGHHFAGPGNLFWSTLLGAGFTSRLLTAFEEDELLPLGFGITNLVSRATASANELDHEELHAGARALVRRVRKFQPKFLAVLGLSAYRVAFERRKSVVGLQPETIDHSKIWLLPNPSGLNAFHQPATLNAMFGELRSQLASLRPPRRDVRNRRAR